MVLILVDGRSSVADLIRKIKDSQLTENALAQLEKTGLIEMKGDSLLAESQRVAQEIRASAIERAIQSRAENRAVPASGESKKQTPGAPVSPLPAFDIQDDVEEAPASRFSMLPTDLDRPEKSGFVAGGYEAPKKENRFMNFRLPFSAQLESLWTSMNRASGDRPEKLKPIRRRARRSGGKSWLAVFVFGFLGLLALAVATALVFPFDIYVPNLEQALSKAVARPVGIRGMQVRFYPEPAMVLENVQLGQGDDAIRIREIRLHPDFESVFSSRWGLRKVVVSGTQLQLERIIDMPAIFAALARPGSVPKIRFFLLKETDLSFFGLVLKNTDAEIQRDPDGNMQALTARSADGSVLLEARPAAAAIDLAVEAYTWRPAEDSEFVCDSLNFKGRLEKDTLTISGLEIRALDGLVQGDAVVHASGAKPNLSGAVAFGRINASRLSEALGIGQKLDGTLRGNMRFSADSEEWSSILSSIDGEGEFRIQRGSLNGIDLAEAARRASGTPVQGGSTNFEQMSGKMRLERERYQFFDLDISSGLMQSTGRIDATRNGQLSGRLELRMRGSVNQTRTSVLVSGTLMAPVLRTGRF
ncbi:MAG: AsmA-like C-terminal region-containing protein [Candidatus Accumulibacter sp.]|nr:AsmA-like C-terminal region-containing protein [Accumulibacter sp.]